MRAPGTEAEVEVDDVVDVAIVGYGPTGMVLAGLMGRSGHSVVVFDKHRGLYNLPRAACFDDEIMRTFQKLDLVEQVTPGTVVQTEYEWVNGAGETLLEVSYDNPARGGWAALYMMYQPHIESVLDHLCQTLPTVTLHQGMAVEGIEAGTDGVTLTASDPSGRQLSVGARYVVGADGGGGFVRDALDIGFSDYRFEENWLVCDFRKLRDLTSVPTFRQVCDPVQPVSIVQIGPEHHRFSFMLDPDETGSRATDEARVWERVAAYISREDANLIRVANYRFRSRIADRWRQGRVMLAGDAAHEMPPFLAQGMCSGMRDSHNLAWKLDLILNGHADDAILDTYQPEREPHVRFITEKAIELGRVQTLRDPAAAQERDRRLLAMRAAQQEPERMIYPGVSAGLIDVGSLQAGAVFPQGRVGSSAGGEGLFDGMVGWGPTIVARHRDVLLNLSGDIAAWWGEIGGGIALVAGDRGGADSTDRWTDLVDVDGLYERWFEEHACDAAVVRPDWYLFGTAGDAAGLSALLIRMRRALDSGRPDPSSA